MNYNMQENQILKPATKKQWKRGKASTESRKASKLIAYISTRPCKVISVNVQYYVKAR